MKTLLSLLIVLASFSRVALAAPVAAVLGRIPLVFEMNEGQSAASARYLARAGDTTIFLTEHSAVIAGRAGSFQLRLVGGSSPSSVRGEEEIAAKTNYFVGGDPREWRLGVRNFGRVRYAGVYPGIDLTYYGNQRQLEYDFIVAPEAAVDDIRFAIDGASAVELVADGSLVVRAGAQSMELPPPRIYQEVDGLQREVEGGYAIGPDRTVGFVVGPHDPRLPLIIDPVVLAYSSLFGGSGVESGFAIAVGADGMVYITGSTPRRGSFAGLPFPETNRHGWIPETFATIPPADDVFVAKIDPTKGGFSQLVYSAIIGGSKMDMGLGIAVDDAGNAYVAGTTASGDDPATATGNEGFPTTAGALQGQFAGGLTVMGLIAKTDAFLFKLSPDGATLLYSTYLGGKNNDRALGLTLDRNAAAYVVGETNSTDFPVNSEAFQTKCGGSAGNGPDAAGEYSFDIFVAKIDTTKAGSLSRVYATYVGGANMDLAGSIAVDAQGNAYATGISFGSSSAFAPMPASRQGTLSGPIDAVVFKLNPNGTALAWWSFLGGSGSDMAMGIAVDPSGVAAVTGFTNSPDFPTFHGFQNGFQGGMWDAFLSVWNTTGSALTYSTYLGGTGCSPASSGCSDTGHGVAFGTMGRLFVTGGTNSINFPKKQAFQGNLAGVSATPPPEEPASDAFVAAFEPWRRGADSLVYSSYLGGTSSDVGQGIAASGERVYVVGTTASGDFPVVNSNQPFLGATEAFVAMIVIDDHPPVLSNFRIESDAIWPHGGPVRLSVDVVDDYRVRDVAARVGEAVQTCGVGPAMDLHQLPGTPTWTGTFVVPPSSARRDRVFHVRFCASDTGGLVAGSPDLTFTVSYLLRQGTDRIPKPKIEVHDKFPSLLPRVNFPIPRSR